MAFKEKREKAKGGQADPAVASALEKRSTEGEISCAKAEGAALDQKADMAEIGKTLDVLGIRIIECQLGLFGYGKRKKAVTPAQSVSPGLRDAISAALVDGRLSCKDAWEIASRVRTQRMAVASACEAMGIRIKPCQLGAF